MFHWSENNAFEIGNLVIPLLSKNGPEKYSTVPHTPPIFADNHCEAMDPAVAPSPYFALRGSI